MNKIPKLFLAPMEGVASDFFRKAISTIGGFDECCTEFLRVPINANCKSLAKEYVYNNTAPIPQAAQIMGSDPILLAEMTHYLIERGAPRVDLNCGCPSNIVTGKGSGSSLLKTPDLIFKILSAMKSVSKNTPITAKIRAGYEDTSLLEDNLFAVENSGCNFITIHPRTKIQGYTGKADWNVIKKAKQLLKIPVVGNGDIETVEDALNMLKITNCDHLMIGRGALKNPWIFHEIKNYFGISNVKRDFTKTILFIENYVKLMPKNISEHGRLALLKQLFGYFFWTEELFHTVRKEMLRNTYVSAEEFIEINSPKLKSLFE